MTRDDLTDVEFIQEWHTPFSDHDYWGKMGYWSISQGVILLLDYCPSLVGENIPAGHSKYDLMSDFFNDYNRLLTIAKTTLIEDDKLIQKITPYAFIQWAVEKKLYIPEALYHAVIKYTPIEKIQDLGDIEPQNVIEKNTTDSKFLIFKSMKSLMYSEVTFTFIAGEMIEIEARNEKCKVGYESLSLKNMHTGNLNFSGKMLLRLAQDKEVTITKKNIKKKQTLKKIINNVLGLKSEPIPVIGDTHRYYGKHFKVQDKRCRADDRAREKAERSPVEYVDNGSSQSWDPNTQVNCDYDGYDDENL